MAKCFALAVIGTTHGLCLHSACVDPQLDHDVSRRSLRTGGRLWRHNAFVSSLPRRGERKARNVLNPLTQFQEYSSFQCFSLIVRPVV